MKNKIGWTVVWALFTLNVNYGFAAEFQEESEKDFSLRKLGSLNVTNALGDVSVQGWALDKVRVKIRKTTTAPTEQEAQTNFKQVSYRYSVTEKQIEVSSQYGESLSIEDRIKLKEKLLTRMDITVFAPSKVPLEIWAIDGKISLKNWNSDVVIRSKLGSVRAENISSKQVAIHCSACGIELRNVRSSLRCISGEGAIKLQNIQAAKVFVETDTGGVTLDSVTGVQTYLSKSGPLVAERLNGEIEFRTQSGSVNMNGINGFLGGFSDTGDITIRISKWTPKDRTVIESTKGKIQLSLPYAFSGDVDFCSLHGKTDVEIAVERDDLLSGEGPQPSTRLVGRVRNGGELLKVFSEYGDIRVFKGKF